MDLYAVSDLFKQYIAQPDREFEIKAVIGAVTYDDSSVIEFDIEDSIIPSEELTLGVAITSRMTLSIRTQNTIPTNAKITPMTRLHGVSGSTEWVPLGSYYVDSRSFQNDVWKFTCYDKLILSQQLYVSSLVYPVAMQSVWSELVGQLGSTADLSVVINPTYMIHYKDEEITMRDMMGYIASAHGASLRMTKDESIAFVKPRPGTTQTSIRPSDYFKVDQINPLKTYTRILLTYNSDGETLISGSGDDDHTLKLFNPFMNQTMLNNLLSEINGFNYTPFTMDWKGRPDLEVGDGVTVTQRDGSTFLSIILTNKMSFKGGLKAVSTAPSYAAQHSEFDFKGSLSKQISGAVQIDKPYYGVTIGRANGIKVEKSDGSGKLILNSDVIEMDDSSGSPIFKLSSAGKLLISAVVQMLEGSTIDWNIITPPSAGQIGAKAINWNPEVEDVGDLANYLTHIGADGIYTGTLVAQQIKGLLLEGVTIKAGTIVGEADAAVLNIGEHGGNINTAYDQTAGIGQRAAIRLCPTIQGGGYMQILEDGGVYLYQNNGTGIPYGWFKPDGTTSYGPGVGGGGGSTLPAVAMAVDFHSDDTGVTISRDGALENWTWTKDEFGKITSMTSDRGRTINVAY